VAYLKYIEDQFLLLGSVGVKPYTDLAVCKSAARDVLELETSLASSHLTKTASRDPELTYNKMSVQSLSVLTQPPLLWPAYLASGQVCSHVIFLFIFLLSCCFVLTPFELVRMRT
jgi:predicted metalloendopeptidase